MTTFRYIGLNQVELDSDYRDFYMTFEVRDRNTGKLIIRVTTDRYGQGRFVRDEDGNVRQTSGLWQSQIPMNRDRLRRYLRAMAVAVCAD